ncbi:rRNA maturation RNase YbeY [Mariniblastus sp.]|nr:rRNA maturation RNase YbeY [Mariniblastus sp.]
MPEDTHKIEIADEQSLPFDGTRLVSTVARVLADHDLNHSEISIAVVDDPAIRVINKQYLDHDYATDVISFVLDFDEAASCLTGQLVVSTDTASNMAGQIGGTMEDELLLYVIHGMLHLVGFDDKDPDSAAEMREQERHYLALHGVEHRWQGTKPDGEPH